MDIKKLITLVQKHEAIYDLSNVYHRNKERIAKLWKDIAIELNSTDDEAKRKWCNLRSNYMREKRRLQKKIENGVVQPKIRWPYYNMLNFVDEAWENSPSANGTPSNKWDSLQNNSDSCSFNDQTRDTIVEEKYQVTQDNVGRDAILEDKRQTAQDNVAEHQSVRKRRTIVTTTDDDDDDVDRTYLSNFKRRCMNREDEYNDPDFMFLRSILPMMKNLGTIESLEFKSEVIDVLKNKLQQQSGYHNQRYSNPNPTVRINLESKPFSRPQSPSND